MKKMQQITPFKSWLHDFSIQIKFEYILVILVSFGKTLLAQETVDKTLPNVLLIVVDDMGWNDVGYHGSEVKTPTLDKLAKEGVELNRFYVHPACSPTRSSLMTGKAAIRLGFKRPIGKNNVKGLSLSEKIMPQFFKENGYSTNLIGKWHLGRFKKEYWPNNRGFDHFYGYLTGGIGHYDHVHGGGLDWQRNGVSVEEKGYSTHLLTEETIKIINAKQEQPFFIELCYAAPHLPNEAPNEAVSAYQHLENKNRQLHAAMISEVDKGIQKIYEALEKKGLLENTIIWFMSDNGGINKASMDKNRVESIINMAERTEKFLSIPYLEFLRDNIINGAADNSPLKGGKNSAYEGGIRVPAFIYAPSFLKQQTINHRVTVNDILPTLATATSFKTFDATNVDGVSQWNSLKQGEQAPSSPYVSVSRFNQAYFKDQWKLVLPNKGTPELYKIEQDPTEANNLASQFPEVTQTLKTELLAFPRGELVAEPLWRAFIDPDTFGGEINRAAFAGKEGKISGPLHKSIYILGAMLLIVLSLVTLLIRFVVKRVIKSRKKRLLK